MYYTRDLEDFLEFLEFWLNADFVLILNNCLREIRAILINLDEKVVLLTNLHILVYNMIILSVYVPSGIRK